MSKGTKLFDPSNSPEENLMLAWFGNTFLDHPEPCYFALRHLLVAVNAANELNDDVRPDNLREKQCELTIDEAQSELFARAAEAFRSGDSTFFRGLAFAIEQLSKGPVDPERAFVAQLPKLLAHEGIDRNLTVEELQRIFLSRGKDVDNRQIRRILGEIGVQWERSKAGRPKKK